MERFISSQTLGQHSRPRKVTPHGASSSSAGALAPRATPASRGRGTAYGSAMASRVASAGRALRAGDAASPRSRVAARTAPRTGATGRRRYPTPVAVHRARGGEDRARSGHESREPSRRRLDGSPRVARGPPEPPMGLGQARRVDARGGGRGAPQGLDAIDVLRGGGRRRLDPARALGRPRPRDRRRGRDAAPADARRVRGSHPPHPGPRDEGGVDPSRIRALPGVGDGHRPRPRRRAWASRPRTSPRARGARNSCPRRTSPPRNRARSASPRR